MTKEEELVRKLVEAQAIMAKFWGVLGVQFMEQVTRTLNSFQSDQSVSTK